MLIARKTTHEENPKLSFSEHLSYAPLHLDDLERIVDAIKEKLPQVLFKDEEYEYESLDEMKEKLGLRH